MLNIEIFPGMPGSIMFNSDPPPSGGQKAPEPTPEDKAAQEGQEASDREGQDIPATR